MIVLEHSSSVVNYSTNLSLFSVLFVLRPLFDRFVKSELLFLCVMYLLPRVIELFSPRSAMRFTQLVSRTAAAAADRFGNHFINLQQLVFSMDQYESCAPTTDKRAASGGLAAGCLRRKTHF